MKRMKRTLKEFPEALETQIRKYYGADTSSFVDAKKAAASALGVTAQAINHWLNGQKPNNPNLKRIQDILNLELIDTDIITPQEAYIAQEQINEQTLMAFTDPEDEPNDEQCEDETNEGCNDNRWLSLYRTNRNELYKAQDDKYVYLVMRQQYKDRKKAIPFVLKIIPRGGEQ